MPAGQAPPGPEPSRDELVAACEALRRRVEELLQEKQDLEVMLETATEHADHLSADLEQERNDLATMLAMTTEHADTVEDDLHENAAEALLKSARQLRMIVEATPAPVLISRLADAEIVYANAMTGTLLRVPGQELLGRRIPELYFDPADRAPLLKALEDQGFVDHQ